MDPTGSSPGEGLEVPTLLSAGEKRSAEFDREKGGDTPLSSSSNTTSDEKSRIEKSAQKKVKGVGAEISPSESADSFELDVALKELPEDERQIIQAQLNSPTVQVNYFTLYRYATTWDYVIIGISIVCAIAGGAALPMFTVRKLSADTTAQS